MQNKKIIITAVSILFLLGTIGILMWLQRPRPMRAPKDYFVQAYDKKGNEILIDKTEWKENILPDQLERDWDNPDDLYMDILQALQDGFYPITLKASQRLLEIDKNAERSHVIRSIALMKNKKHKEAETVLKDYLDNNKATGIILTNLAKIQWDEGRQDEAKDMLWRGLRLDPNQDNGLNWWLALQYEDKGRDGYYEALEKAAKIKNSWRPQLLLAGIALADNDLEKAGKYYDGVLSKAPVSKDMLMIISGDLGTNGFPEEVIRRIQPIYDPAKHDIEPGINLLQAYLETGDYVRGEKLLKQLEGLNRFDFQKHLQFYNQQFNRLDPRTSQNVLSS